uniref:Uncharacterized protein n=1 Tax=Anguilla anguilla TaxID=7936 RepID=A0A0E9UI65_ANGAN
MDFIRLNTDHPLGSTFSRSGVGNGAHRMGIKAKTQQFYLKMGYCTSMLQI